MHHADVRLREQLWARPSTRQKVEDDGDVELLKISYDTV